MDKQQFVQQYVQRQRAYLPTYTADRLLVDQRDATPAKSLRSNAFGFDTPVLRPRVPVRERSRSPRALQAGPSKSSTRQAEQVPGETSQAREAQGKKTMAKRKKASTPIDTDDERAARLADRRERKRKKRAIVRPPEEQGEEAPLKKGRANDQKAKKPAGLALLYGFSATNVTKDRLTLKPVPSLGVFCKGKASAKKRIIAARKSSSKNKSFSESAFLNKSGDQVNEHSKHDDDDLNNCSVSDNAIPQSTKGTKKNKGKGSENPSLEPPQAPPARPTSEVWDIELQSELPSSVCDVSSDLGAKNSAPIVFDTRGAEWSVSINVAGEHEERRNKIGMSRKPSVTRLGLCDEGRLVQTTDVSSIHPSHSASQVGCRVADTKPTDLRLATSKYFADPTLAILAKEFAASPPQPLRSKCNIKPPNVRSRTSLNVLEGCKSVVVEELAADPPQPSRSNDDSQLADRCRGASIAHLTGVESASVQKIAANLLEPSRSVSGSPPGRPGSSAYWTGFKSVSAQTFAADPPQSSRSNDDAGVPEFRIPHRTVHDTELGELTMSRAASPINSLMSVPQPMLEFRTRYDTVVLDLPSDSSPYDDYGCAHGPWEYQSGTERHDVECPILSGQSDSSALEHQHLRRSNPWGWYPLWSSLDGLASYDVDVEGTRDPLESEYGGDPEDRVSAVEPCFLEARAEDDVRGSDCIEQWICERGPELITYGGDIERSICHTEEGLYDEESGADFLEGRALLLGVAQEGPRFSGPSGLVQAEMDVASRLRDHWRPLRL